jgi:uncharacterized membrane protein YeiH
MAIGWFTAIESLGILSFAVTGMIVAKSKGFSAMGIFTCAAATAFGGGTLRDVLFDARPFFWMARPEWLVAVFALAIAYAHLGPVQSVIGRRDRLIRETAETIAFASLGIAGAAKVYGLLGPKTAADLLAQAHLWVLVTTAGVFSSAFGSVIRDVLVNELPGSLKRDSYAADALALGCGLFAALVLAGVSVPWASLPAFVLIVVVRAWKLTRPAPASAPASPPPRSAR